ncbi:hypothetical protein GCM10027514_08340 [Azotobacter armeniacus]
MAGLADQYHSGIAVTVEQRGECLAVERGQANGMAAQQLHMFPELRRGGSGIEKLSHASLLKAWPRRADPEAGVGRILQKA